MGRGEVAAGAGAIEKKEAGVSPVASNRRGSCAAAPLIARPLNVAAPLPSVVAVALLNVAPAGPEAITAVTGTPAPPAGLPAPSRTWSTGCGVNAAPLAAVGGGWVVIVSWVAVPAPSGIVEGKSVVLG